VKGLLINSLKQIYNLASRTSLQTRGPILFEINHKRVRSI
jgi:hypothetical protein